MNTDLSRVDWSVFGGPGYIPSVEGPPRSMCECRHLHPAPPGDTFLSIFPEAEGEDPSKVALRAAVARAGVFHPTLDDQDWLGALLGLGRGTEEGRRRVIVATFRWLDTLHRNPWREGFTMYTTKRTIGGFQLQVPVDKRALKVAVYRHVEKALENEKSS